MHEVEVIGLDHIYMAVCDFAGSERFYDAVMRALGFHKGDKPVGGEPHAHYFNQALQYTIRPAHDVGRLHDSYAPGLHHLCFQVRDRTAVDAACAALRGLGLEVTEPRLYAEYNPDYYAIFFSDPDGIRLEVVCRTPYRDEIVRCWADLRPVVNPLAELRARTRGTSD